MLYAALGDSITYGYSSTNHSKRFVNRLQRQIPCAGRVNVYLTAKPGWTSKQLLRAVKKVPDCIWEETRLITLLVGGNDVLRAAPWLIQGNTQRLLRVSEALYRNVSEILEIVKRPHSCVIVGTIYNPFPHSLVAEECTETLNKAILKAAQRHRVVVTDLAKLFRGREHRLVDSYRNGVIKDFRFFRNNPIHPNDEGHAVIARNLLRTYRQAIRRQQARKQGASAGKRWKNRVAAQKKMP